MSTADKNILVTGGAGYIGSSLAGLLLESNFNVIVMDNLTFGGESLLCLWHRPNLKFIKGDITSPKTIRSVFNDHQINAVIHLAAVVGDPACANRPELAEKVNWKASLNLLEESMKAGVRRFIFASTCSNYGKMPDPGGYVTETSRLTPLSLYADLKARFENVIINELKNHDGFFPTSLRFATAYGISPRMRFDLTVNEFTKDLALGRELKVFGRQFWRPYCHVYDLARAVLLTLNGKMEKTAYNIFNVGHTSENYQKQMIVDEIKRDIPDARIKYIQKDEDPRDYRVSFEKIKTELGFTITKTVPVGIKEVKYLIDNRVCSDPDNIKYRNS